MAAAALVAPGAALAAQPPTILTAGIDAEDQLYATWTLGAGTTYDFVDFATVPTPDPVLPSFFLNGHFAGFDGCERAACGSQTSYTGSYPNARDRRYFVKVSAELGDETLTSAVWVIDETKPLIPGDAPLGGDPSGKPATGSPFLGTIPAGGRGSISVTRKPKTFRGLLAGGVRVRATCNVACGVDGTVKLGNKTVAETATGYATGGTRTLVLRPTAEGRALLRGRPRARLRLSASVRPLGGRVRNVSQFFTVRR